MTGYGTLNVQYGCYIVNRTPCVISLIFFPRVTIVFETYPAHDLLEALKSFKRLKIYFITLVHLMYNLFIYSRQIHMMTFDSNAESELFTTSFV